MKAVTRITFCDDNDEKFFGEGPCRLLHAIEETGSLRSAAISMGLAYTKALRIIKNADNEAYGFRWNLESGEIDLLNPSSPSQAYSVSNNGVVVEIGRAHV